MTDDNPTADRPAQPDVAATVEATVEATLRERTAGWSDFSYRNLAKHIAAALAEARLQVANPTGNPTVAAVEAALGHYPTPNSAHPAHCSCGWSALIEERFELNYSPIVNQFRNHLTERMEAALAHARLSDPKTADECCLGDPLGFVHALDCPRAIEQTVEPGVCGSCGESPENECPKSKRPCGHHCNHVWTHDACDWCGAEFGPDADTPRASEQRDALAAAIIDHQSDHITDAELAHLARLLNKATDGPWKPEDTIYRPRAVESQWNGRVATYVKDADANLIAALRNAAPALLAAARDRNEQAARAERAEAQVRAVEGLRDQWARLAGQARDADTREWLTAASSSLRTALADTSGGDR